MKVCPSRGGRFTSIARPLKTSANEERLLGPKCVERIYPSGSPGRRICGERGDGHNNEGHPGERDRIGRTDSVKHRFQQTCEGQRGGEAEDDAHAGEHYSPAHDERLNSPCYSTKRYTNAHLAGAPRHRI